MTINEKLECLTELDSELSFSVHTRGQWDFVKSTAFKTAKCTTLEELGIVTGKQIGRAHV